MKTLNRFFKRHRTAILLLTAFLFVISGGITAMFSLPIIGMALGKDRQKFSNKGGGEVRIAELTSGGAATTMDIVGFVDESGLNIDPKMVQWDDERGFVINSLDAGEEWRFKTKLMQSSIDEINLIKNSRNKYYHLYYKSAAFPNGNIQEVYIPLVKIISVLDLPFKRGEKRMIEVEFLALMPKGAVNVTPAGFNVAADTYGVIVENADALGQVTTPTGTIYTAAV